MKVFIIGIAGGIGRRVAEQLAEAGDEKWSISLERRPVAQTIDGVSNLYPC